MALYEVAVQQRFQGVLCVNRWNYNSTGTPAAVSGSFGLASAMGFVLGSGDTDFPAGTIGDAWQGIVNEDLDFIQVQVKNVYDPVDFYLSPFTGGVNGDGTTSESGAPFMAIGCKTNRTRLDIRSGSKRFAGVQEGQFGDGGNLTGSTLTSVQTLCDRMSATLQYDDEGNTLDYVPVIISKEEYTTPKGNKAYRYYETFAEQSQHWMTSFLWSPMPQMRHQTSRQYGRGS